MSKPKTNTLSHLLDNVFDEHTEDAMWELLTTPQAGNKPSPLQQIVKNSSEFFKTPRGKLVMNEFVQAGLAELFCGALFG